MRRNLLIVEKRNAAGELTFGDLQPPDAWIEGVTADELAGAYYAQDGLGTSGPLATMDEIFEYFRATKGWHVRPKTW